MIIFGKRIVITDPTPEKVARLIGNATRIRRQ
jgi:hypothetical protein